MSLEKVREYFKKFNMADKIMEFDTSSATVELAARALNCAPERIAKTISFKTPQSVVLVVTAGDVKIDNKKYRDFFKTKAKMLHGEEVEALTGHKIGGVCPFAVKSGVKIYLDESMKRFSSVFPACGSANSAIELSIPELEKTVDFIGWVDICSLKD